MNDEPTDIQPRKKAGRPRKTELQKKRPVGRPKGDAAIINDYKARMLASPKSRKVLDTIMNAALDDDHKHQAAAWKLIMDRIAPVGAFEKDVIRNSGSKISISITGVPGVNIDGRQDLDGEYEEVE